MAKFKFSQSLLFPIMKYKYTAILILFLYGCKSPVLPSKEHQFRIKFIEKFKDPTTAKVSVELKPWVPVFSKVYYNDQLYRDLKEPKYYTENHFKQDKLDKENQIIVSKFLNEFGYPSLKEIGLIGYKAINLTLDHAGLEYKKKYLYLVETAFKEKKMAAVYYSIFIDKILCTERKFQIYGTQVTRHKNEYTFYPLNLKSVILNRKRIGLNETLFDYLKNNFRSTFDSALYEKKLPELINYFKIDTTQLL